MTITVDLPADVAARLADKAAREGQNMTDLMQQLATREAGVAQAQTLAEWNALPALDLRPPTHYNNSHADTRARHGLASPQCNLRH